MQFSSEPTHRPSVAGTNPDAKPHANTDSGALKDPQVSANHATPADIASRGAAQLVVSDMSPIVAYPAAQVPGNLVRPARSAAIRHVAEEEQGVTGSLDSVTADGNTATQWSDAGTVDSSGGVWLAQANTGNTSITTNSTTSSSTNVGGSTTGSAGMPGSVGGDAGAAPYSYGGTAAPAQGAASSGGVLDSLGLANVSTPVLLGGGLLLASGVAALSTKSADTEPVGFGLSGTIVMGKVTDATGLVIEAFRADGTKLAGTGTVNSNGTYTITITENYSGPVLIRLKDTNPGTNYINEATGTAQDLTTDLRAVVNVGGHGTITVAITPLTELATRNLLGDSGGDGGTSTSTLGTSVTTAQVDAANTAVKTAFGLPSDILSTTPVSVDNTTYATATSAQKAYGNALAAISGAESVSGTSTSDVLTSLSQGMVGGALSKSGADLLVAGAGVAANTYPGTISATAYAQAFDTGISGIHISNDTGTVANDFITSSNTQTVTATLTTALSGTNHLWGSVDGGTTWTDVTSSVSVTNNGPTLTWTAPNLVQGDSSIKFAVTASAAPVVGGASNNVIGSVTVQAYSVDSGAPQFTSATTANFAENTTTPAFTAVATDANLLTYSISGGADAGRFVIDSHSGAVSFLNAPNFELPADVGTDNVYNITVTATDGAGNQTSQSVAITVTNVNEAPTLTSGATASFAENGTGTAYAITATDPDANTTFIYGIGGTDATLFNVDTSTGAVTFKNAPNYEAPAHANNVYNITVTASDGAITTAAQAVAISVTNVNEAPTVTSGTTASFAENGTGTAYTVTGTDPDANTTLTYAISGGDSGLFNIDANTGVVTFKTTPNFEAAADSNADNVYSFTVTTSDGVLSGSQNLSITVTDVNEAPTSTTVTPATVVVGQAYSFSVAGNFSDPDTLNLNEHLAYTATGLPTGLSISGSTGLISGQVATTGTQSVTVTATDIASHATSQTFTLNEVTAPVISSIASSVPVAQSGDALTFTVNLSEAVTVAGGTPTIDLNVGGQTLTASYSGGSGSAALTFTATAPAGDSATVSISAIHTNNATITGNTTHQGLVTSATGQTISSFVIDNTAPVFTSGTTANFAENATTTAYASAVTDATTLTYTLGGADVGKFNINTLSGAVTFKVAPNYEAPGDVGADNTYNVSVTATDALGHATTQNVAIAVTNVNEAPTLTSGATASFAENGTGTAYAITATDPDANTTLTYAIGGTDATLFNVDTSTGAVTFKNAPNYEAPAHANNVYNITVTASDGAITTAAQAVAISVTNVNEAPTVTSAATASFAENGTGTAYTVTGTDPDANTTLTYAISGGDSSLFTINANTGVVTFNATPNFEAPADANTDNVYGFTVTTTDNLGLSGTRDVAITVTDVNEAPTSTTVTPATVVVGQAYSFSVAGNFSDQDAGDHLSYAATGLPTGLSINASTGLISGTDAASGVSHVTVTATDTASHTTSQQFDLNAYSTPTLSSHVDNVTNLEVMSNIVLTSTENLAAVTGKSIHIVNDGGTGFHGEATINTLDYLVSDTAHVTIVGNTITINPGFDLDFNNNYHITVDSGAFTGVSSGLASAGIADSTTINFSTVNPTATLTGAASASQTMVSGTDAMVAGHGWYDAEGNGVPGGAMTSLDMSSGNIAIALSDIGGNTGMATNDCYVALNNFGVGDLLYVDNHGNNLLQRQGDFNDGLIFAPGFDSVTNSMPPTSVFTPASATSTTGLNGGQFAVTVEGTTAEFISTDALKVILNNVMYEPIVYG